MPNWCENQATFSHADEAMMTRLNAAAVRHAAAPEGDEETVGFFQEFVPWPTATWDYDWCVQNWGTKWDASELDGDEGAFHFNTAWGPPIAFYDKMTSLGFEVEAMFFEPGQGFCGKYVNGTTDDFTTSTAAERALVPADLADFCCGGDWSDYYENEEPRKVKYMGREAAHQAYLAVAAAELACLICHTTKGEIEEHLGAAPTPEEAAKKELIIKTTFVVPRCGAAVPHLYHRSCLKTWLKKPENNKCPTCQADIAGEATPTPKPESQVSSLDSQAASGGSGTESQVSSLDSQATGGAM